MTQLSLLMPAYNEARTLAAAIDRLDAVTMPIPWELIVIDDGSTDATSDVARRHPPRTAQRFRVERLGANGGKGTAIRRGLDLALGDIIGIQDADLEYDPRDIPSVIGPILAGRADAVFGSRLRRRNPTYSISYKLGNVLLSGVASLLFGRLVTDAYTGYKFMTRDAALQLSLTARGFEIEAQMTAGLLASTARIVEVPISYRPRSRAAGKKIRARDGLVGLVTLVRARVKR